MSVIHKNRWDRVIPICCAVWIGVIFAGAQLAVGQTVVQLPTFHFFTISTTVLVPDGGDVLLGGVNSASSGRIQRGIPGLPGRPFTNTSTGSSIGASNAWVHAEIHDFEAMDKALLADGSSGVGSQGSGVGVLAISGQHSAGGVAPLQSVVAIRAQQAAEDAAHEQEAADALAQAKKLLAENKPVVAKIYLQTALRKSATEGDIHQQAVAMLRSIEKEKSSSKIAGQ